jgi:hypothetical protein
MTDFHEDVDGIYDADQLIEEYAVSSQEAERIIHQFGCDRQELDFLLGHRPVDGNPVSRYSECKQQADDFLFEI